MKNLHTEYSIRINQLEKKYSQYNFAKDEIVSPEYRRKINNEYRKTQQRNQINSILTEVNDSVRKQVQEEVHQIFENTTIKELCRNCKYELIVAVIILYTWKIYNPKLREETTHIWKKYNITWRKYALIMRRLLILQREKNKVRW